MDLNSLMLLLDVVNAGSIAEAARRTGVPKSTLSRKLRGLEKDMGVRLLQRTSRKLGLTQPGRRLVEHARRISDELDEARRVVRGFGKAPRGTIRVTASVSFGERFLAPILLDFLRAHPDVDVQLFLSASISDLITEEIDVAIRAGVPDPESGMVARRLTNTAAYPCASPAYVERCGLPATVADLAGHDAIVYTASPAPVVWVLEGPDGEAVRVAPQTRIVVNSHPIAREATLEGLGIACLLAPYCRDEIADGRLVRLLPGHRSPQIWVYAAFPSRDSLPAAVRAFVEFVHDRLETHRFELPE